ncbi:hypothetical protein A2U01_0050090 [Trifolium medium]|uniref:Transmembrane protein n=1 Tax=Trifolium medium TaxID=97028 RepID=A0A392QXW9_9FABA|nr:hypothetical protein [Trifolium medium]
MVSTLIDPYLRRRTTSLGAPPSPSTTVSTGSSFCYQPCNISSFYARVCRPFRTTATQFVAAPPSTERDPSLLRRAPVLTVVGFVYIYSVYNSLFLFCILPPREKLSSSCKANLVVAPSLSLRRRRTILSLFVFPIIFQLF